MKTTSLIFFLFVSAICVFCLSNCKRKITCEPNCTTNQICVTNNNCGCEKAFSNFNGYCIPDSIIGSKNFYARVTDSCEGLDFPYLYFPFGFSNNPLAQKYSITYIYFNKYSNSNVTREFDTFGLDTNKHTFRNLPIPNFSEDKKQVSSCLIYGKVSTNGDSIYCTAKTTVQTLPGNTIISQNICEATFYRKNK